MRVPVALHACRCLLLLLKFSFSDSCVLVSSWQVFCLCLFFIFATPLCMQALSFLTRDGIPAPVVEGQSPTLWTGGEVLVAVLLYSGWAGCTDFGLPGACGAPLRCDAKAPHHGVFSCGSTGSRCTDFSCCGTRALLLGMCNLLRPGIESVSPVLLDGFLSPVPPGKFPHCSFDLHFSQG